MHCHHSRNKRHIRIMFALLNSTQNAGYNKILPVMLVKKSSKIDHNVEALNCGHDMTLAQHHMPHSGLLYGGRKHIMKGKAQAEREHIWRLEPTKKRLTAGQQ